MEFKTETTKSINDAIRERLIEDHRCHGSIVNTIHAAVDVFVEMLGKQPTQIRMGWNQQVELKRELYAAHLIMMPYQGAVGKLAGVTVIFDKSKDLLEITC